LARRRQDAPALFTDRHLLGAGATEVTTLGETGLSNITSALAWRPGFECVADLLKVARHGPGERVLLVEFE